MVHGSRGHLPPASDDLLSEPEIVSRLARASLKETKTPWRELATDYDLIRQRIERVIPGFENFNERVAAPRGFRLPNDARERTWKTASGKAEFTVHTIPDLSMAPGRLRMMTMRSHDQYNTTIYGLDDRYRGIKGERNVVFMHPDDILERDLRDGEWVDLVSEYRGVERRANRFRVTEYEIPRGSCATYFPEANSLVPLESKAAKSNTPASKSVVVRVEARP